VWCWELAWGLCYKTSQIHNLRKKTNFVVS
jgi:hypothetical protein